jgi:hypothetical protein
MRTVYRMTVKMDAVMNHRVIHESYVNAFITSDTTMKKSWPAIRIEEISSLDKSDQ